MQKIMFLTNHSYMFYQFRRELAQDLLQDYEVVISTPFNGREEDLELLGCKVIETKFQRRGISPTAELQLYRTYLQILAEEKPDFVITYSIKPNVYGGRACQKLGIPYAVNVQGMGTAFEKQGLKQVAAGLYREACKGARVVFFENTSDAQYFIDPNIVRKDLAFVVPGAGVNTTYYAYSPMEDHDKFHFLYLGRIMKEKGVDELFEAMRRIHSEYPDTVLDIVGFTEEDYEDTINQLVKDGIAVFHGFHKDPRPFYVSSDCVVLPSYHEGMSNVLLEAASTGRLLITTNIPGCKEAVELGKTGYLVKPKDTDSLYRMMKKALSLPKEELNEISHKAREKMEYEFTKEEVVKLTRNACRI